MSDFGAYPPAPSDAACDAAWDQIASLARTHALVLTACGGTMVLANPEAQRTSGHRERVLSMHRLSERQAEGGAA